MITRSSRLTAAAALLLAVSTLASAQEPIVYTVAIPEPDERWLQVEATFSGVPPGPLEVRMSRSSPGRYALHEFVKNVFDVEATDAAGNALDVTRPDPYGWTVRGHSGTVRITYRLYGDRLDGTYLAIDTTHAHMNAPATFVWARGLADRPIRITFERPAGTAWEVATQLYATADPLTFTAPNLQYLLDSPIEFGPIDLRTFTVDRRDSGEPAEIRVAVHHRGTPAEVDRYVEGVERIVREQHAIYGELPAFEPGHYTFIADYLPHADGDGMEHRNSTVLTSSRSLAEAGTGLLGTVSHEFFHAWNVERIRPRDLEPFDFERANMSDLLWLAEGFTQYYGNLVLARAGIVPFDDAVRGFGGVIDTVVNGNGRAYRSAVEMSRMAPFVDAASPVDRTNWPNTFISYYTYGSAIALGLDLSLRERSDGAITLDDYMRTLWRSHGAPGGPAPGVVARPYTLVDARTALAETAGDSAFADEFFGRYIEGREAIDYERLVAQAGLVLRQGSPSRAWAGLTLDAGSDGATVARPPGFDSPAADAGIAQDDRIVELAGDSVSGPEDVSRILARHGPGDTVPVRFIRRSGEQVEADLTLRADPSVELVTIEATGGTPTTTQRAFREAWMGSHARARAAAAAGR